MPLGTERRPDKDIDAAVVDMRGAGWRIERKKGRSAHAWGTAFGAVRFSEMLHGLAVAEHRHHDWAVPGGYGWTVLHRHSGRIGGRSRSPASVGGGDSPSSSAQRRPYWSGSAPQPQHTAGMLGSTP